MARNALRAPEGLPWAKQGYGRWLCVRAAFLFKRCTNRAPSSPSAIALMYNLRKYLPHTSAVCCTAAQHGALRPDGASPRCGPTVAAQDTTSSGIGHQSDLRKNGGSTGFSLRYLRQVPAQMWAGPGEDVGRSRRRCGWEKGYIRVRQSSRAAAPSAAVRSLHRQAWSHMTRAVCPDGWQRPPSRSLGASAWNVPQGRASECGRMAHCSGVQCCVL